MSSERYSTVFLYKIYLKVRSTAALSNLCLLRLLCHLLIVGENVHILLENDKVNWNPVYKSIILR